MLEVEGLSYPKQLSSQPMGLGFRVSGSVIQGSPIPLQDLSRHVRSVQAGE